MHIITKKRIKEAKAKHPEAASALDGWHRVMHSNIFHNFAELKSSFPGVDKVGELYVFDVGGNKLRLIVTIHFNRHKVYIRSLKSTTKIVGNKKI